MKGIANTLAVIGILLLIYSIVGKFIGGPGIGLGIVATHASAGIAMANSIMLIAILLKLSGK